MPGLTRSPVSAIWVIDVSLSAPRLRTAESLARDKSLPPLMLPVSVEVPFTVKLLESVTRPLELIAIESLSPAEPILPSFLMVKLLNDGDVPLWIVKESLFPLRCIT